MEALSVSIIPWYSAIVSCYVANIIAPTGYGIFLKSNIRQSHTAIFVNLEGKGL